MRLEAILNPEDLTHYLGVLSDCFVQYNIKPVKKHINLIYDYIRFYKEDLLSSPEASFDFIFNDKMYVVKESGRFSCRGFRCLNLGFFLLKIVVFVFLVIVV